MKNLRNISLADFRRILIALGCEYVRTKGGHEVWKKTGLFRPLIFQTHVNPVSELVVKNLIRDLGISREEFIDTYENI